MTERPEISVELKHSLSQLIDTSFEDLHSRIVTLERVWIFGENHESPRIDELVEFATNSDIPVSHIVIEVIADDQAEIDEYVNAKTENMPQYYDTDSNYPMGNILNYARNNNVKVIAGDMSVAQMEKWIDTNKDEVHSVMKEITDYDVTALLVHSHAERSKVTGEKIKGIIENDQSANVLVICGAGHVALIAASFYGADPEIL